MVLNCNNLKLLGGASEMRPDRIESDDAGQDSFLDVIANVVGVLIILVMLVGVRASHRLLVAQKSPSTPVEIESTSEDAPPDMSRLRQELKTTTQVALAIQRANAEKAQRIFAIAHESAAYDKQRIQLAMHRSIIEDDIQQRRQRLSSERQREFDVQRQLLESQIKLDELAQEQLTLVAAPDVVEEIESIPTPLAKTIEGQSIHLRLSNGLVSIVPFEEMLAEINHRVDDIQRRLQSSGTAVEMVGPIDGYRLKFTARSRAANDSIGGPRVGQLQRTVVDQYAEISPVSDVIGQNVEQALMPGSTLYRHLQSHRRARTSVVVWLYTDSFDEFRPLKRAIWEMGFSLATRPMEPGSKIGASPHGTRAAAQ